MLLYKQINFIIIFLPKTSCKFLFQLTIFYEFCLTMFVQWSKLNQLCKLKIVNTIWKSICSFSFTSFSYLFLRYFEIKTNIKDTFTLTRLVILPSYILNNERRLSKRHIRCVRKDILIYIMNNNTEMINTKLNKWIMSEILMNYKSY